MADGFHTLIMDGVEDGSITTEYPREAAILLSLLLNYWVACGPTAADTEPRTRCVATMLAAIGLPVFNEELIDLTVRGFQAINAPSFYPNRTTPPTIATASSAPTDPRTSRQSLRYPPYPPRCSSILTAGAMNT